MAVLWLAASVWAQKANRPAAAPSSAQTQTRTTVSGRGASAPRPSKKPLLLSIKQAVSLAMSKSKDLKAASEEIAEARAKMKASRARMLPTISVLGVVQLQSKYELDMLPEELVGPLQAIFHDLDPNSLKQTIMNRWTAILGVGITQPLTSLYQLYKLFAIERAGVEAQKHNREIARNRIRREVTRAYLSVYVAREYLAIAMTAKKLVEAHLERVKKALRVEAVRKAELLQVQVKAAEVEYGIIKAQAGVTLTRSLLNYTMGLKLSTRVRLTEKLADPPTDLALSLEACIQKGLANRPELAMVRKRIKQAKLGRQAAWFQYVPTVALVAGYQYTYGMEMMFPTNRWFVGGLLTWSFEWGRKKHMVDEITAKQRKAQHLYIKARQGIRLQITKCYLDLISARKLLAVASKAVKLSKERHRMEVRRYASSANTTTDLLDAQMALRKAKASYAQALYGYYMALADLVEAAGGKL